MPSVTDSLQLGHMTCTMRFYCLAHMISVCFGVGGSFPRPEGLASKTVEVCIWGTLSPRCLQGWGQWLAHWQSSCYCVDITFPEFFFLKLRLLHRISCTYPFQLVNVPLPKSLPTSGGAELPQSPMEHRRMPTETQDLDLDFLLI